jgi:hypothetical protein
MSAVPDKTAMSWRTCPEPGCGRRHQAAAVDICGPCLAAAAAAFWATMGCAMPDVTPKPAPLPSAAPKSRRGRRNWKG